MTATPPPESLDPDDGRPRLLTRVLITLALLVFVTFWTWALFFASKESVNRIGDAGWAARADAICLEATESRYGLADLTRIEQAGPEVIRERADVIDAATDIVEQMLDDLVSVEPTDDKGRAIVPQWEAEYRTYIGDRRRYAAELRESGENQPFYETPVEGIPVSERLATFAADNDMKSCSPPSDLDR